MRHNRASIKRISSWHKHQYSWRVLALSHGAQQHQRKKNQHQLAQYRRDTIIGRRVP